MSKDTLVKKSFFIILSVVIISFCFETNAIAGSSKPLNLNLATSEAWKTYYIGVRFWVWFTSDTVELLVCFNPEDFTGVQYPCWIKKLKQVFYNHPSSPWDSTKFKFRIYAEDTATVLYESPVINAIKPGENAEVSTEYNLGADSIEIDSGKFWVSIYDSKINAWAAVGDTGGTQKHSFIRNTNTGEVSFPPWFSDEGSELATYVYLSYTLLEHDVTPVSYASPPDSVKVGTAYPVSFTVKNKGSTTETFTVRCVIPDSLYVEYADTQSVTNLASGQTQVVTLADWTPASYAHNYTVIFSTHLSGDMIPENDTIIGHSMTSTGIEEVVIPKFRISHFMNPVKDRLLIEYTIPTKMNTSINLYDITGRLMQVLENRPLNAGTYKRDVSIAGLNSGVYFLKVTAFGGIPSESSTTAGDFTITQKLILFK